MKNILIITPFFAPYSHAAVYRAHRFAKYLPRFGWRPYVLTVDKSFLYFVDPALLDDLPKEVEIIRARHLDLTLSGFKSLLEKPVTDSRAIKGPTPRELTANLHEGKKNNFIRDAVGQFIEKFLFLPDRYITWYPFALKESKIIINSERIDAVYSTGFPLTSHLIAMRLKEQYGLPWVADFRETDLEDERMRHLYSSLRYKINCAMEKKVMEKADSILTAWNSTRDLFLSKYKGIADNKVTCIQHCTDVEILLSAGSRVKNEKFTVIFTGEFQKEYGIRFFEILKLIFERKLLERGAVQVLVIGSIKRNIFLQKEINLLNLSDVVRLVDYLSLKDYFGALLSADATLLPGILEYGPPMKISDYLFVKKPVIAFGARGEVKSILERSGLGVFVSDEIEAGVETLFNLIKGNYKFNINEDYINQFSAFNRTKELSNLLAGLINEKNTSPYR